MNEIKEETIMKSDDNTITLTTHRLIQATREMNKELFLKDMVSYEIVKKRSTYYLVLALLFGIPLVLIFLFDVYIEDGVTALLLPILVTFIGSILYLTSFKRYLKITGRLSYIQFSLANLSKKSLDKFIARLMLESENRKKDIM